MSVFPVFKITKMLRRPEDDITDFIFLGQQYRLIARPVKYWKYFPWFRGKRFDKKSFFYQCPWLTFFSFPSVNPAFCGKSNSLKNH